ncbi:MAG: DUF4153 domain-containing protein [Paucimonas sp.]|jgi:hypothetical protein|uniref:DUF4153 domain-containing protein n=1 Tax=Pantoea sp. Cy-639 TaxID=2608360 RepID=UPI00141D96AC|nr:DUF4153 domain-containing protein [Pantoea sp. Cy-639]MDR2306250.1 DUF4153 domain-containing protein [Paucimonas sp.]NIF17497.1 DUF4153 domain-containing protein [Pantoea sp. Cy-639]
MSAHNRSLAFYLVLGLVQGLALYTLYRLESSWLAATLGTALLVAGLNLQLLGSAGLRRGTGYLLAVHTLLMVAVSFWLQQRQAGEWLWLCWLTAAPVLGYICTAFILSWPTREGLRPRYLDLFQHAWNTVFIIALAWLLCGLFALLLWLCGALFEMLHIPQPAALFSEPAFLMIVLPVVFSVGMRMGCQNDRVIGLLRGLMLSLCRFLLPLAALITVLFAITLPFTGVQPVWDTGHSSTILLSLVGVVLFLVNGVFQDGEQHAYPQPLRRLVEASLLCLPGLAALAGWSTWLRIEQYGLMPSRILALLLVLVAMLYSLAALWAVFARRGVWLGALRGSNVVLALFCALLIVVFFTPVVDPVGRSVHDQVRRLVSGRTAIADFDVGALRYRLGDEGTRQLDALREQLTRDELFDEAGRAALLERLDETLADAADQRPRLEWLGPVEPGEDKLEANDMIRMACRDSGCVVWPVDLDGDGRNEVVVASLRRQAGYATFYVRDAADDWHEAGSFFGLDDDKRSLAEQLRAGKVKLVAPRYKTLQVDGKALDMRLER